MHCICLLKFLLSCLRRGARCALVTAPSSRYAVESGTVVSFASEGQPWVFPPAWSEWLGAGVRTGVLEPCTEAGGSFWASPYQQELGELGRQFPFFSSNLNRVSGCWGLASGTYLGVTHSHYGGGVGGSGDCPVEALHGEHKLCPEPAFLGSVFNRLDMVRKPFFSNGAQ